MQIHPSVIMSISEHHTRFRAINYSHCEMVTGVLLGIKTDKNVEILDSFELSHTLNDRTDDTQSEYERYVLDTEYLTRKITLVKQVHADLEMIGWYATVPFDKSLHTNELYYPMHKQVSEFIPNPIFLKLNPYERETDPKISGSLPINVYEPVIGIESEIAKVSFIEVSWTIVTEDVEIIGLEHNAKMTHINVAPSAAIDNLRLQYSAVKMLKDRIKVISKFVKDIQSGALPHYEETLADIAKLSKRFPLMNSQQYTEAYNMQCNDVALNTYLGILTKGSMCKMHFGMPSLKTRAYSTTHARR